MPKKKDDMADRLQSAALELFQERGYDRTTTAEIAARAGVTERTFFRYFHDKREVLFGGQAHVLAALTASIKNAPQQLGPLETLFGAFRSMLPVLEANRLWLTRRHEIIAASPALQEREIMKATTMGDALADVLKTRGVSELRATLAARIGMTAFGHATGLWLGDPNIGIGERLELSWQEIKELLV